MISSLYLSSGEPCLVFFVGITNKQTKNIIHPDFMVDNKEITDQFIQNLKRKPNKVHNLTGEMKKSFKKQRSETNILPQIHKISRITDSYGITTYLGSTFNNMEFPLEPICMGDNFEFSEPYFYKQVTERICDLTGRKTFTVPVGRCSLNTSQEKQNYLDMHSKAFTSLGKSNKKKEQVPDGPTIKYSQGIKNSCILSSLALALYYMGDVLAS